ncbi:MAG: hypothetical protein JWM34_3890 [Ilumatobacteraceae bacterium]|nr:hypothetical protein [Ilumatobacteraceae bacterium]
MDVLTGSSHVVTDDGTAPLLLAAVRRLIRVTSEEEVVGVLIDAVRDLGGTVISAQHRRASTLPIDLSFGIGEPLLADVADPVSHRRLQQHLQALRDDAALAIARVALENNVDDVNATDPLTGLGNWNATMQALGRLVPGDAIALFELENLKQINDYYGVETGDQVILGFARTVRRAARAADSVGRVGGTEFVWLLRGSTLIGAESALARLRDLWSQDRPYPVTYAAGLALVGQSGPNEGYMYADLAVQNAKRAGVSQTMVSR